MGNPIIKTLWADCLSELVEKAKREGKESIEFKDVDDLVLKKSKGLMEPKEKTISLSFRDKSFIINCPKSSISILEYKDMFTIAVDGVNEMTDTY